MSRPRPTEPLQPITFNLPQSMRAAFIERCTQEGIPASIVLRRFVADWVSSSPTTSRLFELRRGQGSEQ